MTLVISPAEDALQASEAEFPEGWVSAPVHDLVEIHYGSGLPESNRKGGEVSVYGSNGVVGSHTSVLTAGPTVVLGRKGSIGTVHYSPSACWPIDTTYYIDDFRGLDPIFLVHALRTLRLDKLDTSTAIPGLNRDDIYGQVVGMPPLAEQKRIVTSIESLFAHVNSARQNLTRIRTILKRFRQAVLSAACSGRLTEDWREHRMSRLSSDEFLRAILVKRDERAKAQGVGTVREPTDIDLSQLSDVPEEWVATNIDQISCMVTSGSRGWARYYADSGPLFIRAQDINTDRLQSDGIAHVQPPANAEGKRTRVRFGDLLVTITGANVTKAALVDREIGESYVSQHVALVRLVDPSVGPFLYLWTVSPVHGRAKLLDDAYGAGKPGLNLDNIKETTLGLPPPDEQVEIVHRVDSLFALADAVENHVSDSARSADRLGQSILAKAFRGELVPTEAELARREGREYEPGSVLLERIKKDGRSRVAAFKSGRQRTREKGTLASAKGRA